MGGLWWLIFLGLGGAGDRLVLICLMFLRSFEYVIQYIARADKGGVPFVCLVCVEDSQVVWYVQLM